MKTIENKSVIVANKSVTYKDIIVNCVNSVDPKSNGLTVAEMRKRIRILDACEKATEVIELEDNDFNLLKEIINNMRWGIVDRELLSFSEVFHEK